MRKFLLAGCVVFSLAVCSHAESCTDEREQKPLEVALTFLQHQLPEGDEEGRQITTIKQEPVLCAGDQPCHAQSMITLTIEGLLDDSIRAERHTLILERAPNQSWQIIRHDTEWAC